MDGSWHIPHKQGSSNSLV